MSLIFWRNRTRRCFPCFHSIFFNLFLYPCISCVKIFRTGGCIRFGFSFWEEIILYRWYYIFPSNPQKRYVMVDTILSDVKTAGCVRRSQPDPSSIKFTIKFHLMFQRLLVMRAQIHCFKLGL